MNCRCLSSHTGMGRGREELHFSRRPVCRPPIPRPRSLAGRSETIDGGGVDRGREGPHARAKVTVYHFEIKEMQKTNKKYQSKTFYQT